PFPTRPMPTSDEEYVQARRMDGFRPMPLSPRYDVLLLRLRGVSSPPTLKGEGRSENRAVAAFRCQGTGTRRTTRGRGRGPSGRQSGCAASCFRLGRCKPRECVRFDPGCHVGEVLPPFL